VERSHSKLFDPKRFEFAAADDDATDRQSDEWPNAPVANSPTATAPVATAIMAMQM